MKNVRRTFVLSLVFAVTMLGLGAGSVFAAATAASPEFQAKAERVRSQIDQKVSNSELKAAAESLKALRIQIDSYKNDPSLQGKGSSSIGTLGVLGQDFLAPPTGPRTYGPDTVPDYNTTANWAFTPPIAKFIDTLPGLDCSVPNANGQCIPIAVADTVTYPGSDYYEIILDEWDEPMSSDMPATRVRGYVQTNNGTAAGVVGTAAGIIAANCTTGATPSDNSCNTVAPQGPHYLGPIILSHKDRPVRIKFTNMLPSGAAGDLFIPVDQSVMGAGQGPLTAGGQVCDNTVENNNCAYYTQNRATIHLHGGRTPWISDGTPHQWITPAGTTPYPKGVSVANVPDMEDPGDGSMTFYYSNQQTARLMFYHDHAFGITRLNVLAGMAAGYLITDEFEQDLITRGVLPDIGIPLVIQDRTFVNATLAANPRDNNNLTPLIRHTDPLWNWGTGPLDVSGVRTPQTGDLWLPHVYMPAQNPENPDGLDPFGRWMYGPWFYPATTGITHPPIANPYYDADCSSTSPWVLADCNAPGQPSIIPATPHPSMGMEAFFDSIVVNGTAFPTITVDPKAYRFKILNAANDRAMNLSIYKADSTPANMSPVVPNGTTPFSGAAVPVTFDPKTEVKTTAAVVTAGWPDRWPVDGRAEGVPDPGAFNPTTGRWDNWGPSFIQIGTDSGFLPKPAIRDPQPIQWFIDPTAFWVGTVSDVALALMPAERADVIVDFSAYAGQTLIVYNDAPAAWPAGVFNYDYWTGAADYRDSGGFGAGGVFNTVTGLYEGGHGPLPGFAPNTRTVMQIVVGQTVVNPPAIPFSLAALNAEFTTSAPVTAVNPIVAATGTTRSLFDRAMEPIIVAQPAYDEAYGKTFPSAAPWGGVRYSINDDHIFNFQTIAGEQVSVKLQPKGIHDEMGASFDAEYGRMSGNLAIELSPPQTNNANLTLYGFSDIPTEIVENSGTAQVQVDLLGQLTDGTQIWNVSHNGVDTHPIHFHIFDVQLISRLGWDNQIQMPKPNELGWKDVVRIAPLMDTIVAVRPVAPVLPFGIPNSMRPLNPAIPIGSTMGFSNVDPATGQAYLAPHPLAGGITNRLYDFGWEYVWHCHILSHEEMDMMRPIILNVATLNADGFTLTTPFDTNTNIAGINLQWTDPSPVNYEDLGTWGDAANSKNEIGFNIWRSTGGAGVYQKIGSALANHTLFTDPLGSQTDVYAIEAYNTNGSTYSNSLSAVTLLIGAASPGTQGVPVSLAAIVGAPLAQSVTMVEYFNGTTLLGSSTTAPYSFNWVPDAGVHSITAVATALVPDPPASTTNSVVLTAVSAATPFVVTGNLSADFTVNLGGATGICDPITLVGSVLTGTEVPFVFDWTVDGVALPVAGFIQSLGVLPEGPHTATLTVTDNNGIVTSTTKTFTVNNTAPTAVAGGPYTVAFGGSVTLAGLGADTVDAACNATALQYAWDIDNDGLYDYFDNRTLPYSQLQPWLASLAPAVTGPTYTMTFRVTDPNGATATATATLTVAAPAFSIATAALPAGTVGTAYSLQLVGAGGTAPYTWHAYGVPAGVTLSPAGLLSGTPLVANVMPTSTFATIPVSIIMVDSSAPKQSIGKVMFINIFK